MIYRLTITERDRRYRLIKEIVDPDSPILLTHVRLGVLDSKLNGRLRPFALLAPHMKGTGNNHSA